MTAKTWYLIRYTDPAISGHWGRLEAEVADEYPTEEEAWAELRRRKAMLRWAGSRCTYYGVSDKRPGKPDKTPLRPFDPLDAGEALTEADY